MNERIRELSRRVVGKRRDDAGPIWLVDEQLEKFAELIVRECIRLCDQVDIVGADECIDNIKEHFSVEE